MSTRAIGDLIAPIIAAAIGVANLQDFLDQFERNDREWWIMEWWRDGTINTNEAALLVSHNGLDVAA